MRAAQFHSWDAHRVARGGGTKQTQSGKDFPPGADQVKSGRSVRMMSCQSQAPRAGCQSVRTTLSPRGKVGRAARELQMKFGMPNNTTVMRRHVVEGRSGEHTGGMPQVMGVCVVCGIFHSSLSRGYLEVFFFGQCFRKQGFEVIPGAIVRERRKTNAALSASTLLVCRMVGSPMQVLGWSVCREAEDICSSRLQVQAGVAVGRTHVTLDCLPPRSRSMTAKSAFRRAVLRRGEQTGEAGSVVSQSSGRLRAPLPTFGACTALHTVRHQEVWFPPE